MHLIGIFNLIFAIAIITSTLDASIDTRYGEKNPWIKHVDGRYRGDKLNRKPVHGPLVRIRRNKEKIPLMFGKSSSKVKNKLNENGILSDLQVDCRTSDDCSAYQQSACTESYQCNCTSMYPVFVQSQKSCVKPAALNTSCSFLEQCAYTDIYSECDVRKKMCACIDTFYIQEFPEIGYSCVTKSQTERENAIDPTMITVLVALILMFVIICVVLRLFSKARFRENRSIFNTPNPRLMNASLFKDKRRGSALSTVSATGSAAGSSAQQRPTTAAGEDAKNHKQTTVAIEAVD